MDRLPPIDGTLVVAIGQGMEALTQGVCMSTTHRVLSPAPGSRVRFSVPFFQGVSLDAEFEELNDLEHGGGVGRVPESIREMRRQVVARGMGDGSMMWSLRSGGVEWRRRWVRRH